MDILWYRIILILILLKPGVNMLIEMITIILKEIQLLIRSLAFSCSFFHILCLFFTWNEIDPYYFKSGTNYYEIM